ncbi:MAG: hypothetical protein GXP48_10020 [Acidobacteria bacterium]|nr:hypothetical protein [Acidobacteriota bacterium]
MSGLLGTYTSLPNLHPALVHFPVALAITALGLDLASLAFRRQPWLERATALLYGLAAAGAGVAYLAGRQAAGTVGAISPRAEIVLADHADLALWTLLALTVAAALRITASFRDRARPVGRLSVLRGIGLLVMLGAGILIARTADLGGSLVFRYGVAVAAAPAEPVGQQSASIPSAPASPPGVRLMRATDGALEWRPAPGDRAAIGRILEPAAGSDERAVVAVSSPGVKEGLSLAVHGSSILVFPGTFGNLVMEARLDMTGFQGTVGLAYHVDSDGNGSFFTLSDGGQVRLERRTGDTRKVLGSASVEKPKGGVTLRTSVAGHHLKGFVDGAMVLHRHGSSGTAGRAGLAFSGKGVVRVISVTITPVPGS